jgi:hypothetical protein
LKINDYKVVIFLTNITKNLGISTIPRGLRKRAKSLGLRGLEKILRERPVRSWEDIVAMDLRATECEI